MTEPQRLKDKYAGTLEGLVLGSARVDVPSIGARRRTLVTLGVAVAASGVPVATTAAAGAKVVASAGLAVAMKWGALGIAVGALTLGGVRSMQSRSSSARATLAVAKKLDHRTPAPSSLEAADRAPVLPSPDADFTADDRRAPPPKVVARPSGAPRAEPISPEMHLADEVPLLDRARQALKTDPERTLALIDDYLRRFPDGELRPEALVLRIDALVRDHQQNAAEALAKEFLARYPRSAHAKKIRTALGWSGEGR